MEARIAPSPSSVSTRKRLTSRARFGANIGILPGFVFELWFRRIRKGPVQDYGRTARYDNLLRMLGAKAEHSAVGCAMPVRARMAPAQGRLGPVAMPTQALILAILQRRLQEQVSHYLAMPD